MMSFNFSLSAFLGTVQSRLQPSWARNLRVGQRIGLFQKRSWQQLICFTVATIACFLVIPPPAWASLTDDRYDGEIFALYAGNGSLVPPKVKLADSIQQGKPAILVFYIDDSRDCKQFSSVVSQLQANYGRVANFLPVRVDSLPIQADYEPTEAGYYYRGYVPQTVVFDQKGQVKLDEIGQVSFEAIDDSFRQIFDLLPRAESLELKRRKVNEVSTELVPQP
ncbi:MAG: thylakoid membrane photosystem I accumulation factor [Synechococcales bacterium]|nr:thylakoid membrane photosystem I accumulation factor [Synechococcales bacterium]